MPEMTPRERFIAAVRMEPVDRIPFWPKVFGGYMKNQSLPFSTYNQNEMFDYFDAEPQYNLPEHIVRIGKRSTLNKSKAGNSTALTFAAPGGECRLVLVDDPVTMTSHPMEFPIKNIDDIRIMTAWYNDSILTVDGDIQEQHKELRSLVAGKGPLAYFIGESPLMYFVEYLAGIENAHYLLSDYPADVEELFAAMHRELMQRTVIACDNPYADLLYFAENTSTTLISPSQYNRYCLGHIDDYGRIVNESGKPLLLHMCGHLKKLLPVLSQNRAQAFEAFTSPTVGNTTLLDGRTACPDKALIGGTNAVTWLNSAAEIIEEIDQSLSVLPHTRGVVLSSSGVTPPAASPETITEVIEWLKQYLVRN